MKRVLARLSLKIYQVRNRSKKQVAPASPVRPHEQTMHFMWLNINFRGFVSLFMRAFCL